jgi:hypothetical protein
MTPQAELVLKELGMVKVVVDSENTQSHSQKEMRLHLK